MKDEPNIEDALEREIDLPTKRAIEEAIEAFDVAKFVEGDPEWVLEGLDYEDDRDVLRGDNGRERYRGYSRQ